MKTLTQILNNIDPISPIINGEKQIYGLTYNSKLVKENEIFIALSGQKTDGNLFIDQAIKSGASVIISEKKKPEFIPDNIEWIQVNDSRKTLAQCSANWFDHPSEKLTIIGITGTNGKTTTSIMIKTMLELSGISVGLIGTLGCFFQSKKIETGFTTPESLELNKLFLDMIQSGITHVVMEVSSHALDLKRVHGIKFSYAIFTNLTHDHLDFHGTVENYLNAKKILFDQLTSNSKAILNQDDPNWKKMSESCKAEIITYGLTEMADWKASGISSGFTGQYFTITGKDFKHELYMKLPGKFNIYNSLAAISTATYLGVDWKIIRETLNEKINVPGRFQTISSPKNKWVAVVDYSHTPDSLEKTLQAIQEIKGHDQKVVTIFGCGGDRDKTKRPKMGEIACKLSDHVIITSDNPRTENPELIIQEIAIGCTGYNPQLIVDRKEAIFIAVHQAEPETILLIAGKGHENYQEINGVKTHFDDAEIVAEAFEKYGK